MLRFYIRAALAAVLAAAPAAASAAKIVVSDEAFVDVKGFVQVWGQGIEDGAPDGESLGKELYVRRARIFVTGKLSDRFAFILGTDTVNIGKTGAYGTVVALQDAFGTAKLVEDRLVLDAGLFLPAFLHSTAQGAGSVAILDLHGSVIKFGPGTADWRDGGVQLRGNLFDGLIQARLGVFNGIAGAPSTGPEPTVVRNETDALRYAGSVRVNVLEPETDFYYQGINFGKKKVLSFGAGFDSQRDAALDADGEVDDYVAYGADVYLDVPVGEDQEVVFQAMASRWENGEDAPRTGLGAFVEAAYRRGVVSPFASWERFFADAEAFETEALHLGTAWYVNGHATNVKLDLGLVRAAAEGVELDEAKWQTVVTAGLQLYL